MEEEKKMEGVIRKVVGKMERKRGGGGMGGKDEGKKGHQEDEKMEEEGWEVRKK